MPTYQVFVNDNGEKIDKGFQMFNSYRIGYHIKLFDDLLFIQPSICITHRAFHTELPDGFRQLDDKWSKFIEIPLGDCDVASLSLKRSCYLHEGMQHLILALQGATYNHVIAQTVFIKHQQVDEFGVTTARNPVSNYFISL